MTYLHAICIVVIALAIAVLVLEVLGHCLEWWMRRRDRKAERRRERSQW